MPQLTLHTSPRACSLACHFALEESGLPYTANIVRIRRQENRRDAFLRINPRGTVPVLQVDDQALTETPAILAYVGEVAPQASGLLPGDDPLARARAQEWMSFLASTVHIAFRRLFRPYLFLDDEALFPQLRDKAATNLRQTLLEVDARLQGRPFALGERYSVCDAYLQVFWIWSQRDDIVAHVADMPHWRAQAERVFERPATWTCLAREGVTADTLTLP